MSSIDQDSKLVEAVARAGAFARRSLHDQARDADHYWENLSANTQDEELKVARAIIPIVLEEAAGVAEGLNYPADHLWDEETCQRIAQAIRSLASDVKEGW
jgi:hypothetical protein